jgi:hypothetical protein
LKARETESLPQGIAFGEKQKKGEKNTNTHSKQRDKCDHGWCVRSALHEEHTLKFVILMCGTLHLKENNDACMMDLEPGLLPKARFATPLLRYTTANPIHCLCVKECVKNTQERDGRDASPDTTRT